MRLAEFGEVTIKVGGLTETDAVGGETGRIIFGLGGGREGSCPDGLLNSSGLIVDDWREGVVRPVSSSERALWE